MRLSFPLLIIAFCLSCSNPIENFERNKISEIKIPLQNLQFNIDRLLNVDTYTANDTFFIILLGANGNYLSYNTKLNKIDTLFNFNRSFSGFGKISGLTQMNRDSALVIFRDRNSVGIWNRKSMKIRPIASSFDFIQQHMKNSYGGITSVGLLSTPLDPPRFLNGKYYIPKEVGFPVHPDAYMETEDTKTINSEENSKDKLTEEYNNKLKDFGFLAKEASYFEILTTKSDSVWIKYSTGFFPKSYLKKRTFLPLGHFRSNTVGGNNELLVSYLNSHSIFVLNTLGKITEVKSIKSKYIKNFNPIQFANLKKLGTERAVTEPYYGCIYYDSYRQLYYRFAIHRQEYLKKDKIKVNTHKDRSFSIIVFDSSFKKLREIRFQPNKYHTTGSFVSEKGFFLRSLENGEESILYHGFKL